MIADETAMASAIGTPSDHTAFVSSISKREPSVEWPFRLRSRP